MKNEFLDGFLKNRYVYLILALLGLFFTVLSLITEGYYGGADNITHYLISHYAFQYPDLFLNAWGRPLYTILSAPFAQFGLHGAKLFNILLGLLTAWFSFRIARQLEIRPAALVLILVCFTPLWFMMMPTALTEILFGFVLVLFMDLFLRRRYIAAAVAVSFLPFARTEGFVLLPLFFLALLWARQYRAIPFLASGVAFFSILGSYHYGDLFWVFTRFPYPVGYTHPIYNQAGDLLHFFNSRDYTLGWPLQLLFIAGVIALVRDLFSRDKILRHRMKLLALLVIGPFLVYFALHSVLYWKAMGGSMGLVRVLAGVMPLAALVALKGVEALLDLAGKNRYVRGSFLVLVMLGVMVTPFTKEMVPYPLSPEEKTIREACDWIRSSPLSDRVVYYTDNNVPYYLERDPWKKADAECHLFGDAKFLDTIPEGSLLVWDAHFGTNESKIPLDSLLYHPDHRLIAWFRPEKPWITFGGYDYECGITLVTKPGPLANNLAILDSLREAQDARHPSDTLFLRTYENPGDVWDTTYLSRDPAFRGNYSLIMDGRTEYSQGLILPVSELKAGKQDSTKRSDPVPEIKAVLYVYLTEAVNPSNTLLVISFENDKQPYSYTSLNLNDQQIRPGQWRRVALTVPLPAFKSPGDLLKVYIWNPGKQVFFVDDFRVEIIPSGFQ